jgi:hypothetical protein
MVVLANLREPMWGREGSDGAMWLAERAASVLVVDSVDYLFYLIEQDLCVL